MSAPAAPADTIMLPDRLYRSWVETSPLFSRKPAGPIMLDFSETTSMDSAGAAFIHYMGSRYRQAGYSVTLTNIPGDMLKRLQSWHCGEKKSAAEKDTRPLFERIGDATAAGADSLVHACSMFTEMLYWGTIGLARNRTIRRGSLGEQMYQLGFKALGIVILLAFLIGMVISLQTAMQLKTYGAGIFLAPLIGISMIRELGPLLTAIILAGRTGSATTAEIATMAVEEELDALQTMGIRPVQFVVVPKFWAITMTMPLLSILATFSGIFGGFCVAVMYLEISPGLFWGEFTKNLHIQDVMAGFIKSVAFSWIIIWIGAFYGFQVRGGAEAVGRQTTASVVAGIFTIIIADAIFSFII